VLDRATVTTGSIEGSFAHCPLPPTSAGMELDRELIAVRPVIEGLPAAARSCRATPCTACVHLSARVRMLCGRGVGAPSAGWFTARKAVQRLA